jgi:fermentation-respiration switch protein FrsA (DUF1100 family)
VLIIHGEADTVIGPWHGRKLYDLANDPKKFVPVEGADHNDLEIVAKETYGNTLRQFAGFVYQHQQGKAAGAVF